MKILTLGDKSFANTMREILSPMALRVSVETEKSRIQKSLKSYFDLVLVDEESCLSQDEAFKEKVAGWIKKAKRDFILISGQRNPDRILQNKRLGAADTILKPFNRREFILRFNAVRLKKMRISCIGGGTGLFHLLLGLKNIPNVLLTSIVNMSDDGGSSGKLSQTFGILPPGDIRRSLVALSNAPELMNQIIQHRFEKGGELHGHSFGNIFLAVLAEVKGSMSEAVRSLSEILNIQGIVLPATQTLTRLNAQFVNKVIVKGESKIDLGEGRDPNLRIKRLWLRPEPECDFDAFSSIINSDLVTIGPGDLYTSVISNLSIKNLREALVKSKARKIYICNLMTKPGETAHFNALDHVKEIIKYLGEDCLDAVLISNTLLSNDSILEYAKKNQSPVAAMDKSKFSRSTRAKIFFADIGSQTELVRHDSRKLAYWIEKFMRS